MMKLLVLIGLIALSGFGVEVAEAQWWGGYGYGWPSYGGWGGYGGYGGG